MSRISINSQAVARPLKRHRYEVTFRVGSAWETSGLNVVTSPPADFAFATMSDTKALASSIVMPLMPCMPRVCVSARGWVICQVVGLERGGAAVASRWWRRREEGLIRAHTH